MLAQQHRDDARPLMLYRQRRQSLCGIEQAHCRSRRDGVKITMRCPGVRQVCDGGPRCRIMYLETVVRRSRTPSLRQIRSTRLSLIIQPACRSSSATLR
jgi:hypothetical protein